MGKRVGVKVVSIPTLVTFLYKLIIKLVFIFFFYKLGKVNWISPWPSTPFSALKASKLLIYAHGHIRNFDYKKLYQEVTISNLFIALQT